MSNMVLTKNFYNFIRTILLSNPAQNGIICSDNNTAHRGWSGTGYWGDSVVLLSPFTNTSGNLFDGGLCGSVTGSNGYYGQQVSLNKFDTANVVISTDIYKGETYFKIGSGTTPATENDYNLESQISDQNAQINLSSIHYMENGCGLLRFFVSVKNIGSEDFAVSEIGMFKFLSTSNYSTSSKIDTHALFGRSVLPSPYYIEPQGIRMFIIDIKI